MRLNPKFKVREMAGEHVVLMQGKQGVEMTKVIAFNDVANELWKDLSDKDFTLEDVISTLESYFEEYDEEVVAKDAKKFVDTLIEHKLVIE
ncbi:MAG: PqqD family protein [Alistipes sp.]|nr:PqqD family protein [Candidatus Alistipes equi]